MKLRNVVEVTDPASITSQDLPRSKADPRPMETEADLIAAAAPTNSAWSGYGRKLIELLDDEAHEYSETSCSYCVSWTASNERDRSAIQHSYLRQFETEWDPTIRF